MVYATGVRINVWFEPTDVFRASKPFLNRSTSFPKFISPNLQEFQKIYETVVSNDSKLTDEEEIIKKGYQLIEFVDNIIITMGKKGVLIIRKAEASQPFYTTSKNPKYLIPKGQTSHRFYQPDFIDHNDILNVSGAGDCFASGFIAAMLRGKDEKSCVEFGFKCSAASLKCSKTVPLKFDMF